MTATEVWEEGYAAKDLNKRFAEHLERKEDLEKRRKKLAQVKRQQQAQARKGSSAGGSADGSSAMGISDASMNIDDVEYDFDLTTEADAIRSHLEQLKRYIRERESIFLLFFHGRI